VNQLTALISGLIFGFGLILSGMTNPAKVIGFLDLFGAWNPSLAFVMMGAIAVTFIAFKVIEKRNKTLLGEQLHLPGTKHIDLRLIIGGFLFGVGWAYAGYCPGPAIVALGDGRYELLFFIVPMILGMKIIDGLAHYLKKAI
jgi:uncharacterized membrane protein YedE/YeeE